MASNSTRTAILDAAERLFAAHGYDATSIREVTREAGVNVAAIHYHFGGKEDVLRGVTDRIVRPLTERRAVLLDGLLQASDPVPARILVEAFIRPDVEALQRLQTRGPQVAHFLGRIYADRTPWIQEMAASQFVPTTNRFVPAFLDALPHLDEEEVRWRIVRMVAVIVEMFSSWPPLGMSDPEADQLINRYVDFLTPALSATPQEVSVD